MCGIANNPLTVTSAFATQPGNARFTLDPELFEIEFTIARNDVQFPGWSVQGLVGGEPRTGVHGCAVCHEHQRKSDGCFF